MESRGRARAWDRSAALPVAEHGFAGDQAQRDDGGGYDPTKAQRRAKRLPKRPGPRKLTDAMRRHAYARLAEDGWSFGACCGRAKRDGKAFVCKETLYRDYYARVKRGEALPPLPRSERKRPPPFRASA